MRSETWVLASCVLGLTVGLGAVPPACAHAREPVRLVLRLAGTADRALLPRLRGQLSDVSAQLIVVETSPLEAAFQQQLEVARALQTLHAAEVIVWCVSTAQPPLLHIALPRAERILTRELADSTQAALSSSDLETAALLVRSVLVALAQDVEVGLPVREALADTDSTNPQNSIASDDGPGQAPSRAQPDAAHVTQPTAARPPDATAPAPAAKPTLQQTAAPSGGDSTRVDTAAAAQVEPLSLAATALRARLSLAAQLALDGQSSWGQRGLHARAGVSVGVWTLCAYGVLSLASEIEDRYFALSLARHAVGLAVERQLPVSDGLWLGVAVHGGALLLRRTSQAASAGAVGYPASLTAAFAFGPELVLGWLPSRFGASLRLALDILPDAPRFETAGLSPQNSRISHQLWSIEPRITLGWETALP